ncbi:flavin monoamine oxidase family protein [Burkholderia cepacia]|uniref:flavin monoamine oxidase family protein n=1 Tax=Burkholderia cepacia TaxID=292 RepID=UPI002018817D|nr:FAD-dependent oxidoreductase [Burkholderia cepacia]UQO37837.1 FAD-dependent oxidoreductase [Burkholderia cepacia]UQO52175.1 FAD-dependent oxidoreductase [Burkholderia cepacia]UQP06322.1 FAD-dependent oxidoreductase [Burkholderia cepacia]
MTDKSSPDASANLQRRQWLTYAGATAAASSLALGVRSAHASVAAVARGSDGVLDVVIIGAGLAGLTAARDLQRAGCHAFVVLEARNRVGGRTCNHDLGHGVVSEAGGQWIGPGQTAIADLARELEVDTFPTYYAGKSVILAGDARVTQDLHGTGGGDDAITAKLDALARGVPTAAPWTAKNAAELDKLSFGDWLLQQGVTYEDGFFLGTGAKLSLGGAPAQLGLLHYLQAINSAGNSRARLESIKDGAQETRFVGGSQVLSLKMADALDGKVRLSCPVRKISGWDRDVVVLDTDRGVVRARRVIVALNPALCNQIVFDPPLPDGRAQLQQRWPANAPMRKTVHVYDRPFWRDDGLSGQIFQVDGPLFMAYDNSPPDGSVGIISAFVSPGSLPGDPKAAERTLSEIYARAFGDRALRATQFHDFDWGRVDPWTLQCIHPIPPGFWTKWGKFLRPSVGGLIWSGTETADIWAGAMDGAVRSGHKAALQALAALAQRSEGA